MKCIFHGDDCWLNQADASLDLRKVEIKEVEERLSQMVKDVEKAVDSEEFKNMIAVWRQFHHYSVYNMLMILTQKRTATRVAGFRSWRKFGRYVKKGEKGIMILCPRWAKRKVVEEDPDTGEETEVEQEHIYFVPGYVFDITQTEGKDLPEVETLPQGQDVAEYYPMLQEYVENKLNLGVREADIPQMGYTTKDEIVINSKYRGLEKVAVIVHEIAHQLFEHLVKYTDKTKKMKELEAESTVYVVNSILGIPTMGATFYITAWTKTPREIMGSLNRMHTVVQEILDIMAKPEGEQFPACPVGGEVSAKSQRNARRVPKGHPSLLEARKNILRRMEVKFEYYPPPPDGKCKWVCLECDPAKYYTNFPAFEKHIRKHGYRWFGTMEPKNAELIPEEQKAWSSSEKLPHPLNIYTSFYTEIEKLTGDLPTFLREMKHIKLKSKGFMDLVIESIGNNRISMAHYYEQEHDLMADPEMEIEILTDQKIAEPLTYRQDGLGIYNVVYGYDEKGNKTHMDPKMKTHLRNFFRKWLQNIKMQQFTGSMDGAPLDFGRTAKLTPEEDKAWIYAFTYYVEEHGMTDEQADEAAWKDIQEQFPRLKEYTGVLPKKAPSPVNGNARVDDMDKWESFYQCYAEAVVMESTHPSMSDEMEKVQDAILEAVRKEYPYTYDVFRWQGQLWSQGDRHLDPTLKEAIREYKEAGEPFTRRD